MSFPTLKQRLQAAGFSFHTGTPENASDNPHLLGKHWYAWCGPAGNWDVECGPTCDTYDEALLTAVDALIVFVSSCVDKEPTQ